MAGASESNVDRRERLRKLALETIDLAKVRTLPLLFDASNMCLGSLHSAQPSRFPRMSTLSYSSHQ